MMTANPRAPGIVRNMTLALDEKHDDMLTELSQEMDMSKTQLIRSALRMFKQVHERAKRGDRMTFVDETGKVVDTPVGVPKF